MRETRVGVYLPKNIKKMLKEKYIGEGNLSGFFRDLLQRRLLECKILVCVDCGEEDSAKFEVRKVDGEMTIWCHTCNKQTFLMSEKDLLTKHNRLKKHYSKML